MNKAPLMDIARLQTLLAIARSGSPNAAAKADDAQPVTYYRQIETMEAAAGSALFIRQRGQWAPTNLGKKLIDIATEMERRMRDFSLAAAAQDERATGLLRVTASDAFANFYLASRLATFARAAPGISVELIASNRRLDLTNGEADIAIRPHSQPGDGLVGRRTCRMTHALYASHSYLADRILPLRPSDLQNHDMIGYGRELSHFDAAQWTANIQRGRTAVARFNDVSAMARAVEGGLGIAILPIMVGDQLSKTQRLFAPAHGLPSDIWLLYHESQRKNLKVKTFMRHFASEIKKDAKLFEG